MSRKPRLLWISDACAPTGFATVTHNVLGWLGTRYERIVLGLNATGDPYPAPDLTVAGELTKPGQLPFPVFPARVGGDFWGFARMPTLVRKYQPDVVVIQSDAWIVSGFLEVARVLGKECPPIVGYMPIDGKGMKRDTAAELGGLALAVFYTQFGVDQAKDAGITCPTSSIGLGVRREIFQPIDKAHARRMVGPLAGLPADAFVFGNVNRNQPRKRLDLCIAWFAEFLKAGGPSADSWLYLHCMREDVGWDLAELAHFYGVTDRVVFTNAETPEELTDEAAMRFVYNALDCQLTTTMGEGWGLPTLEGMACGVPQICPQWAALGEWAAGAVRFVEVEPGAANVGFKAFGVGATPIRADFLEAMADVRADDEYRRELGAAALKRASERRFDWKYAAECFDEDLTAVLERSRAKAA